MYKKYRLSTALDVDDLLMECVPYAIRLANEKYGFNPPLTINEVDRWGKLGTRADVIFEFFNDPEFYKNQPVIKGAKEFVHKLSKMTEIFVSTSVYPEFMSIRAMRIMEEFPEIPPDHIYMGSRKDKIDVDILFDDGMHNIFLSNAAYPILLRRPWNREATGVLAVNNYDEFLKLFEVIAESYSVKPEAENPKKPKILVLVGPTGSNKNEIADIICETDPTYEKLVSYTTAPRGKGKDRFRHISVESFLEKTESGEMFESTNYAGHFYGCSKNDVEKILKKGKNVITVMDICGAMALKTQFSDVMTVYISRYKSQVLADIIERDFPTDDKVKRILAIDNEKKNEQVCDYSVNYTSNEQSATEILDFFRK